jgi:CheY-like chemotaxis protein
LATQELILKRRETMTTTLDQSTPKVMIVDDDQISAAMPAMALSELVSLRLFSSGEAALAEIDEFRPDVVLLDIRMPGMDGYETCRRLRAQLARADQPAVMFLSSLESLEDRMAAYEAGGDDFILKPADPADIVRKVLALLALVTERKQLQAEHDSVQKMAMGFLTNLGETGTALSYLRNAPACADVPDLAHLTLSALADYGLDGTVQCRLPEGEETYNPQGPASPLERSVFAQTQSLDRIFQFRSRLVVNYPHASILVQNMPIEDDERCGRLRDYLAIVAEGCESNLRALIDRRELNKRTQQIEANLETMKRAIETLRQQYREQQIETRVILQQMNERLAKQLLHFGLSDGQEALLNQQLDGALQEALDLFQRGLDFEAQLGKLQMLPTDAPH